jgi:putative sporulation protein YyaC
MKVYYFNSRKNEEIFSFSQALTRLFKEELSKKGELVLLCIGSDRATGDCLGPMIGYKLSKLRLPGLPIYGTLSQPVHAKNLAATIEKIHRQHPKTGIVAIDASLGLRKHIGYITLGKGSLSPGIGVEKELPSVGDISITGIVNISGMLSNMVLQSTRLEVVMGLADFICLGMKDAIVSSLIL